MRSEMHHGLSRETGRFAAVAWAVSVLLPLAAMNPGAAGQTTNLRKALLWEASEVPRAWNPNPDDTPFWPGAGEGSIRNGLPQMVWWWVKFMGEIPPPEKILPRSEGYEIDHPRLKDYRQAVSGVSWQAGPLFLTGPGGHETVTARFLVMEFQTIDGAGTFIGIVRGLFEEAAPGRAQLQKRTTDNLEEPIKRRLKEVGTVQLSPGCEHNCAQIRESTGVSGGFWGWDLRPVSLGDEGVLFLSTFTQRVWEVLWTCRDKRWAKLDSVKNMGDFPILKDGWGLIRRNNFVLAVFFQAGGGYEGTWGPEPCGGKYIPPKEVPMAAVRELIIRAYERLALGAGMPPNIPKDPFGQEKKQRAE